MQARMMIRWGAGFGLFWLATLSLLPQKQHFAGSVRAGQPYIHDLGRGLVLVVTTSSIEVRASPYRADGDSYARCVTMPARGPNDLYLDAWHFIPSQNHLFSHPLHREFQFTVNAADQKGACDDLEAALHSPPVKGKDGIEIMGTPGYKEPPLGSGIINLSNVQLSHPAPGQDAEIQSFSFVADIILPHR
jgi:hypothetical protein